MTTSGHRVQILIMLFISESVFIIIGFKIVQKEFSKCLHWEREREREWERERF